MKKLPTTFGLTVLAVFAIVSISATAGFGQEKKTAKVDPSAGSVTASRADGWRTIQFETTQVTAPDVAVTPDGEWLIFTMLGKLFRLSVKGGEAEQLTFGPYYDNDPAISPNGKLVAFQSDRDGTAGNIFVLTLATKEIRQLTNEVWADRPNWAPDGQSLLYLQLDRKSWNPKDCPAWWPCGASMARPPAVIRRVGVAGGAPETLRALGNIWSAFFLPDGRLAWTIMTREKTSARLTTRVEVSDGEGKMSTLRVFDGIADTVTASPKGDGFYTRFSKWDTPPPEPSILFAANSDGAERRIIPVSGVEPLMGTQGFAVSTDNGTMYLGNLGHLWRVALPGGRRAAVPFRAKVTLTIRQPTAVPKWAPAEPGSSASLRAIAHPQLSSDGTRIMFQALGNLWEQPVSGGQARLVLKGDGTMTDFAISPDWQQVAFVHSSQGKREIRVVEFHSQKTRTVAPATECGYHQLSWSTHGELIASTACDHDIIAIDTFAPSVRVVAKTKDWEYWEPFPELSADGKTIYFQADLQGTEPAFYRLRLEPGAKPEKLVPVIRDGVKMKTHGQWIAGPVQNGSGILLSKYEKDGGGSPASVRTVVEPDGQEFSFAPDGSALLYVAGNKLWRHPLNGGAPREIPIRLESRVPTPPPVLVERLRLLDFAAGGFGAETSLLIENGRIRTIGAGEGRKLPNGTVTVDAEGRFVIPGLFDMHGHFGGCGGAPYVSYGVTSVRNMGGRLEGQNAHADRSELTGDAVPRCFYPGRILEGPQGWSRDEDHFFVNVFDEDDARSRVRQWKAQGAQFIKLYNMVPWPLQRAAADEARRVGLPVAAHGYMIEQAVKGVTLGYGQLTHWLQFYDDAHLMFAAAGTQWEPTMARSGQVVWFRNDPERFRHVWWAESQSGDNASRGFWAERMRTMRSAYRRGVTFLPGTDNAPEGLALLFELEAYDEAGIPPIDILRFATKEAAKTVGGEDHLGTLEAGKLADLILLDANPLEDIKNTQKIWRVFKGGWMFDPKVLRPGGN